MSGNVKQFVDFTGNTNNDTGENNASSIQPVLDGESVIGTVLTRPSESLRQRTEAFRDVMADSLYLRDADRSWVVTGPRPTITWPGSTTAAASGIPVLGNALWVLPLLTPGAQANSPPVASAFGVLHLKRSSDSSNSVSVTSRRRSYSAGDQINVTVASGGSFSCALDVETGLRRTIKVVATGTTTLGAVITALNGLTPPAPDNTQLVTAALEGGAISGDFILAPQARQYVAGNYDGEAHQIGVSTLASFFSSNPTQALAEGDTLCIRYDMVSDPSSTGGRRQSILENSNTNLPAGSLFNSRVHPELLTNAIPVCKVVNNDLVFPGGRTIQSGAVLVSLAGNQGSDLSYGGGGAWADGTANPATSMEGQLDKIVSDLTGITGGANGAAKIHAPAIGTDENASNVSTQLSDILTGLLDLSRRDVLLDTMLAGIGPGTFGASADPEDPSQMGSTSVPAVFFSPSPNLAYALRPGAARFSPGSTGTKLKIEAGIIFQPRTGQSPAPGFIPTAFNGTDEFTFAVGDATNPRIDLLQMKLDWATAGTAGYANKRVVTRTINIKQGTPAATPAMPNPDANFVALCHVFVAANWTGANPIGRPWYNGVLPQANVLDQRMPLGVDVIPVRVGIGALYDPAIWVRSQGNRWLTCSTSTDSATNRLDVPCPARRGRIVGLAINAQGASGSASQAFLGTLEEPAGHGESYDVTSLLSTAATMTVTKGGFNEIDKNATAFGGGVTFATNYGIPLWANGWSQVNAPFLDHLIEQGGTTVGTSGVNVNIRPHLNLAISEVIFFVATGI